ncbi:hypothetical protein [Streptomyces sp. 142MFCol3.1]|uniref:hypothetical protein n=1 Tax=Streptomyces sp. 142MFCol3.1 TaxID=1172179 RepID=UPI00048FAA31|nr:hypothetical protein [Streptomyces sp. 142MFCol3.1]
MGALNVEFSDAELEDLRAVAREHGMTLKAFVRASTADAIAHQRALKEAAAEFQRVFADPALGEAIVAAGIDDGPVPSTTGRVA